MEDACHVSDVTLERDAVCWNTMIGGNLTSPVLGRQIHANAVMYSSSRDMAMTLSNAHIDMYQKSGEMNDANQVFYEMEEKKLISWTILIVGYGMHGHADTMVNAK